MTWCWEAGGGGGRGRGTGVSASSSTKQALVWLADVAAWLPLWGGEATVIPLVHRRAQTRQVWLADHSLPWLSSSSLLTLPPVTEKPWALRKALGH